MIYPKDSVFVTGIAKAGKDDGISSMFQNLSLVLIVDGNNRIIDAGCTMLMAETVNFIRQILIGHDLAGDLTEITEEIRSRFFALSQKALIAALYDAQNHYFMSMPDARSLSDTQASAADRKKA